VVVDIGTGSGSAVLRRAAREPETLFIALDADASGRADASRRAARSPARGGRANVIFLVVAAETLPDALAGIADELTVILPWGSLLHAVVDPTSHELAGIAACLAPLGLLTVLVSATARDGLPGLGQLDDAGASMLARRYIDAGFDLIECRAATRTDVELLSSGWGRRLGIPERRCAWLLRAK
jgi:16S rRNA (adenine(1408)-N(1))-methyltransferase